MPPSPFKQHTERIEQLDRHLSNHALHDPDLLWALAQAQYSCLRVAGRLYSQCLLQPLHFLHGELIPFRGKSFPG